MIDCVLPALDFISRLISFDPAERPTAEEALAHSWLATYHDVDDEPVCQRPFDRWQTIEELETLEQFRDALVNEVYDCRREVRNFAALSPDADRRSVIDEDITVTETSAPPSGQVSRSISPEDRVYRRPNMSRKASIEPGTIPPSIPENNVAFPGGGDPIVAHSRRSIFGHPSRTNSTYSLKQVAESPAEGQQQEAQAPGQGTGQSAPGKSTVAFPSTGDYVVPARHRTASMYTLAGDVPHDIAGVADVRRLLRTLSTVSIYESGEGHAGGLADIAPIGKYIVQKHRTGDDPVASEMPREIVGGETSESPSAHRETGAGGFEKERRFTL